MTNPSPAESTISPLGAPGAAPLLVEVTRGPIVESRHLVDAAIIDADGKIISVWGEVERPIYPRSAIKPLQALPLVESGAADAFELNNRELSIACASHAGEQVHVETVLAWLDRLGLSENDLECGGHWPRNTKIFEDLIRSGAELGPARSNCSGKHSGMLSHAVHSGDATAGYVQPDHPVQRRVAAAISDMCGIDLAGATPGVDGCSVPNYAIPLAALARGMARLANPDALASGRAAACRRIAEAMWAEPYMVAGYKRCCTALLEACAGTVVAKTGAEGVYMAGVAGHGLGLAVKARDGAGRASEVAILALLDHLGVLDDAARQTLAPFREPDVLTVNGAVVGGLKAAGWSEWSAF